MQNMWQTEQTHGTYQYSRSAPRQPHHRTQVIEQFPGPYSDQLGQEGIKKQHPWKVFDTLCHMRTLRSAVSASVASRCSTINRKIQHSYMPQPQGCEAQASRNSRRRRPPERHSTDHWQPVICRRGPVSCRHGDRRPFLAAQAATIWGPRQVRFRIARGHRPPRFVLSRRASKAANTLRGPEGAADPEAV